MIVRNEKRINDGRLPKERLLPLLKKVKQTATGWTACCPAHDDGKPSLSISETDDHTLLVKCFAGCTADAIVAALNLELRDLFPTKVESNGRGHQTLGPIV